MNLQNIIYAYPQNALFILFFPIIIVLYSMLLYYRKTRLSHFANSTILSVLMQPRSKEIFLAKTFALCAVWICSCIALMQPMSYGYYMPETLAVKKPSTQQTLKKRQPHHVILLMDASASMSITDGRGNTSRLNAAKEIADALISHLDGQSVALYAFTTEPMELAPLTTDYLFVRMMLKQLQINEGGIPGTSLIKALSVMRQRYFLTPPVILKTLIIFSDGGDTLIESLQGKEKEKALSTLLETVEGSASHHVNVVTIGVGSTLPREVPGITFEGKPVPSALDATLLQAISQKAGGNYFDSNKLSVMELATKLASSIKEQTPEVQDTSQQQTIDSSANELIHDLYFQVPLGLAILLLSSFLLLPDALQEIKRKNAKV